MLEVEGLAIGFDLIYACPVCTQQHTHGSVPGETIAHRISHCPKSDESVQIKVETAVNKMDEKPKKSNAKCALEYYYRKKDEILKRKLVARMETGYIPKISTLRKYDIPIPT